MKGMIYLIGRAAKINSNFHQIFKSIAVHVLIYFTTAENNWNLEGQNREIISCGEDRLLNRIGNSEIQGSYRFNYKTRSIL